MIYSWGSRPTGEYTDQLLTDSKMTIARDLLFNQEIVKQLPLRQFQYFDRIYLPWTLFESIVEQPRQPYSRLH